MHLVKHIHVFAPTGPAADIQAQSVRLLFFQILCCVFLPSFRMCCVVLWFIYFLFIFFFRGAQPHHPSLWSDLRVVHIKAYACISRCDAALLLSRCVFWASLFTVGICGCGFGPWRDPMLNSVSWSSALLFSAQMLLYHRSRNLCFVSSINFVSAISFRVCLQHTVFN